MITYVYHPHAKYFVTTFLKTPHINEKMMIWPREVFRLLIAHSIKEGECSDTWKFVARHCENGSSQIKVIDFDHS